MTDSYYKKRSEEDMIYLATPYSHKDAEIREQRHLCVTQVAARLMVEGHKVFSPVTHCHPLVKQEPSLAGDWDRWGNMTLPSSAGVRL